MTPPDAIPTDLAHNTAGDITQFFASEQIDLEVLEATDDYHALELIGARRASMNKETVHEIYYTCCGEPIRVIVAPNGSRAASRLLHNVSKGNVQQARNIGKYVVGLLSSHKAPGLLDSVQSRSGLAFL